MKNKIVLVFIAGIVLVAAGFFVFKKPAVFNFIFKYGIEAGNELDTFKRTYTKDMVEDPPVKVEMSLSKEEMGRIYQKMLEIKFFDYPEKFSVTVSPGEPVGRVTPNPSYYFKVTSDSKVKELWWDDNITNKDEKAERLRELVEYIISIIESKREYKELPPSRGGYL